MCINTRALLGCQITCHIPEVHLNDTSVRLGELWEHNSKLAASTIVFTAYMQTATWCTYFKAQGHWPASVTLLPVLDVTVQHNSKKVQQTEAGIILKSNTSHVQLHCIVAMRHGHLATVLHCCKQQPPWLTCRHKQLFQSFASITVGKYELGQSVLMISNCMICASAALSKCAGSTAAWHVHATCGTNCQRALHKGVQVTQLADATDACASYCWAYCCKYLVLHAAQSLASCKACPSI